MNIVGLFISFGLLLIAMSVHEFAHGMVAYKLGDTTAKNSGRLTLNPLAHIDIVGTVIMPLLFFIATGGRFVFGTAKPVPINYWALKNPKQDIIWIGLSGPLANLILAFLLSIIRALLPLPSGVNSILGNLIFINVILAIFNLIPIPPLDGSRIVMGLLPRDLSLRYSLLEPYGFFIILLLMWLGIIDFIIWPIVITILNWLKVAG